MRQKVRADLGITYEDEVLRLIDVFRERDFLVENVVITQYEAGAEQADMLRDKLERLGMSVLLHRVIPGYPNDIARIVSPEGFGRNEYVQTSRDVVVMTAPGPGSGKLATCLSQVYQDNQRGTAAGYAKFETFPIWNLPLEHPVNLAYEAATVDLDDNNVIDQYHLAAYGEQVSSYNRDIEVFPLLKALLKEATGTEPYQSPTDMGVNMAGYCISDDEACRYAAQQEIIRRFLTAQVDFRRGDVDEQVPVRAANVMRKAGLTVTDRPVVCLLYTSDAADE